MQMLFDKEKDKENLDLDFFCGYRRERYFGIDFYEWDNDNVI